MGNVKRRGRIHRYREVLEKRAKSGRMPQFVKALAVLALLLGAALPFRVTPHEAKTVLSDAFGITPTPIITPTPTPEPVSHVVVVVSEPTASPTPLATKAPEKTAIQILIYHTHATEAYRQTEKDAYEESGKYRTKDPEKSVVAVGEKLKLALEEQGYEVIHDVTNHEPPKLSTAYSRSLETMLDQKNAHRGLRYFIDVHRDAYGSSSSGEKDYVLIDGRECARLMFVVGTGKGATGTGFSEMPDFDENHAFAEQITENLRSIQKLLMRDVRVKTGRYNQHVSDRCLLVEVGHNANTLEQALNSVPYLAKAIDAAIKSDAA